MVAEQTAWPEDGNGKTGARVVSLEERRHAAANAPLVHAQPYLTDEERVAIRALIAIAPRLVAAMNYVEQEQPLYEKAKQGCMVLRRLAADDQELR